MGIVSSCGLVCDECESFDKSCPGCLAVRGAPFWTKEYGIEICPLYDCAVNTKGLPHYGACQEMPCGLFRQFKDPAVGAEEHEKGIRQRVARLESYNI